MRGALRRWARSQRVLALLTILLITSMVAAPLLPLNNHLQASSTMAPVTRNSRSDIAQGDAAGSSSESSAGLQIVLSEGTEQPQPVESIPAAPATPLDEATTQQVIDRLPPLEVETGDVQEFRLPEESLPPPQTGSTITTTFPTTETQAPPEVVTTGPVEVLRFAPEGEIPLAPFLSVTFNQPMVPLATVDALTAAEVPVKLTPEVPGIWRWVGTQTLTFEYAGGENERFPMATTFTAEIPAGTRSATGNELEETLTWTFATPAPTLTFYSPSFGPQRRDVLMFAGFDQLIDPAAVLDTINVTAGGQTYAVRQATTEEVAANADATALAQRVGDGRWVAFHAEEEFPANSTVVVNVGPGTPSAEGPRTTEAVQSFSFTTYAPLRIEQSRCSWGGNQCPPMTPFEIDFNNPLDQAAFDESWITVEPEIPGLTINNFGYTLQLTGATKGRTTYTVTLDGDLLDQFGQTLGSDQTVTFTTGPAQQTLYGTRNALVTVDPSAAKPSFTVYSVNYKRLRVRAYAVTPDDWPRYVEFYNNRWQDTPPTPPGREVISSIITVSGADDALVETSIDLSNALSGATGHLLVIVDYPPNPFFGRKNTLSDAVIAWVQVTQIGLDAFNDNTDLVAWATALKDGAPLAGVDVHLLGDRSAGVTDENGVARLSLPNAPSPLLVAEQDDDIAILPRNVYPWYSDGWMQSAATDEVRWYVFDDRGMYRPGEEVHIKGWMRRIGNDKGGDITLLDGATSVRYQIQDPQGSLLVDEMADVNNLGGFDFSFTIPTAANLGYANVMLTVNGASGLVGTEYYHSFQIQEFRRPEFSVAARNEGKGPYFVEGSAEVAVNASYFAGGPLPNAETTWNVTASPGFYSPPNWPDFTFGKWIPWWNYYQPDGQSSSSYTYESQTDASGTHYLRMDFAASNTPPRPWSVNAEAVVMDVNRQVWSSSTSLLVHPANLYVGLRSARTFVKQGDPLEIEAIVTDLDGNPVEDRPIHMIAERLAWEYKNGNWQQIASDPQECSVGSQLEPVSCTFTTEIGGEYRITATIEDSEGRANQTELTRWVSGGSRPASRNVEQEVATLIPDKESYQPGDTAEILVQSPFTPAEGLVTINRSGIISTETFSLTDGTYTLLIPIMEEHIPNIYVNVELVGEAPRTDDHGEPLPDLPTRPAYASGEINLPVPPLSRQLAITATVAMTELAPGGETSIDLRVVNADGTPVEDAELAVVVVDEAILALTNYQLSDPMATFYQSRWSNRSAAYGRAALVLATAGELAKGIVDNMEQQTESMARGGAAMPTMGAPAAAAAPEAESAADMAMMEAPMEYDQSASEEAGADQTPITIRTDFNPLALFDPAVRTDAEGQATLQVKLPDNLTRYRVMVVAVADGTHFGSTETNLTARLPLMVRPSAPRFLNFGDRFELPVVVQNQTAETMTVDVVVSAGNLQLTESEGLQVEIPANDRREVRFPATTLNAGQARLQIAAVSGEYADAATVDLPVYTPATTEAFATYGVIDEGAIAQPVAQPQNVFPQFGGLEISTSSTALQELTDAVLYLTAYPYECSEQIASRILGVAALRDVLTAFQAAELPAPDELEKAMDRDIARLATFQNDDGGFPIWSRGRESVPYYSIHVTHALMRAKEKGYQVPDTMLNAALDHLRKIEIYYPSWYSAKTRHALSAYALYVRDLMGDVDTAKARQLLGQYPLEEQSLEAVAWIWQVLSDDPSSVNQLEEIRRFVNNSAVETASAANFITSYGDDAYLMLHSNRRTDAIVLDALINDQPDSDLIPKVVNGLLANRTAGRWQNTQENVFILVALDRYFNTFESVTPNFVARLWLGDTYVAEHQFEGRSTDTQSTSVPMGYLVDATQDDTQDIIVAKEGDGRLYYRLGLRYAPTNLDLEPLDMGFTVQRVYEPVDDPADVTRDEDGTWHIKAGTRVRVKISLVANTRRYHVALVDPLPAGLEIINPALAVSEDVPTDPSSRQNSWWWWPWYEHQNLRDERAEAFTTLLWEGVYTYSYVARATTPGEFVVPPTKAEEMYTPEVFGRSASDKVIVE
jgi:alpha-2-macroglobulin